MAASSDDLTTGAANAMGPEEALTAAEAAHLAARRTLPVDAGPRSARDAEAESAAGRRRVPGRVARRQTVRLPAQRDARRASRRRAPLAVAAGAASGWAAVQVFLPVVLVMALVQLTERRTGSLAGLARLGLAGWLLGHGVPLRTGAGALGLAPLALSAFAAWRVARAGVHVTRALGAVRSGSVRRALTVAVAVALAYGLIGALAAVALGSAAGLGASAVRAGLTVAVFGLAASAVGALGATGAAAAVAARTPPVLRDGVRAGAVAALLVLGAGAGLAGLALAIAGGDAADTIAAYRTGVGGQVGITLLCLAYAPNLAAWAAAYLVGPGFAVGAQTTVRVTEVSLGALPAVPLFAGLPHAPLGGAGTALLAVPLLAGATAGWLLARRQLRTALSGPAGRDRPPARERAGTAAPRAGQLPWWPGLLGAAALAGPVAGVLLGLAAAVSAGPLGGGRLATVGPVAWQVAMVAAGVVGAGALAGAAATRAFAHPAR